VPGSPLLFFLSYWFVHNLPPSNSAETLSDGQCFQLREGTFSAVGSVCLIANPRLAFFLSRIGGVTLGLKSEISIGKSISVSRFPGHAVVGCPSALCIRMSIMKTLEIVTFLDGCFWIWAPSLKADRFPLRRLTRSRPAAPHPRSFFSSPPLVPVERKHSPARIT